MNIVLDRLRSIGRDAWLAFVAHLNAVVGLICAGVVMLNQTNPGVVQAMTTKLTPTQQALASLAFCSVVQYALNRARKA